MGNPVNQLYTTTSRPTGGKVRSTNQDLGGSEGGCEPSPAQAIKAGGMGWRNGISLTVKVIPTAGNTGTQPVNMQWQPSWSAATGAGG